MLLRDSLNMIAVMAQENCGLDNLVFSQSGQQEFRNLLTLKSQKDKLSAYPFVFINETTVSEVTTKSMNDKQVKIGEIVIATISTSQPPLSATDRDIRLFDKILNPYLKEFMRILRMGHAGVVLLEQGDINKKSYYKDDDGNAFSDAVSAYQLTNLKLRIK